MNKTSLRPFVLAFAAALALAACGGDDDGPAMAMADEPGQAPASATASVPAFTAYVVDLPASDIAEPLTLTGVVPPVSDTEEPIALR